MLAISQLFTIYHNHDCSNYYHDNPKSKRQLNLLHPNNLFQLFNIKIVRIIKFYAYSIITFYIIKISYFSISIYPIEKFKFSIHY